MMNMDKSHQTVKINEFDRKIYVQSFTKVDVCLVDLQ